MTDYLITGGSGLVGANLARVFEQKGRVVITRFRSPTPGGLAAVEMDVRDESAVAAVLASLRPRVVIHAAANKNVKSCEENPQDAAEVNSYGARNVARACRQVGAKIVYISSDLVFECERGGYREVDAPRPTTVYGKTKLEGEKLTVEESGGDALICRTGGIYGRNSPLLKWLDAELCAGRAVDCFTDVLNTPTYVDNLAEMIDAALLKDVSGVLHMVGRQRVSRLQWFRSYARAFEFNEELLQPTIAGDRRARMLLQADASLSIKETERLLGVPFNSVDEGMDRLRLAGGVYSTSP